MAFEGNLDNNWTTTQPSIKLIEQELNINKARQEVEKSKKSPELLGGLYLQSFRTNVVNKSSGAGLYAQFGVGLPLFNKSIQYRLEALNVSNQIVENKLTIEKQKLQNQYQQLVEEYNKYKATVLYYETDVLQNINLVTTTANTKLANGDINYLEWVLLINQNTELESNYLEAIRKMNEAVIHLTNLSVK